MEAQELMMRPVLALAVALIAWSLTAPPAARSQAPDSEALAARIDDLRRAWRIPGAAVAIVRNDTVILARGFGVRRAGAPEPVDAKTLFAIGSTTKAFTSTAIAVLVADGVLDWDDPVSAHLPDFRLADPWRTSALTIRDILAHRSGLPMANLMWLTGLHGADEMIHRLRFLESTSGFRDQLAYQNVLYAVAGAIVERVAGEPWSAFVENRILAPLRMDRTRTGVANLERITDVATPHAEIAGTAEPVPYRDIDAIGPAGSMLSSAEDLAAWLRFQLGDGHLDGDSLVRADALLETHRPQIVMRAEGPLTVFYPGSTSLAYGMGWLVSDYRGRTMLDHGGGIDGMTALIALVPEERLGVAILTNLQTATPPYWILYPLLDALLGEPPVDHTPGFRAVARQVEEAIQTAPRRIAGSCPSLPLSVYAGRYAHPALGEVEIVHEGSTGLAFRMGRLGGPLLPWHFDTFRADWEDRAWLAAAGSGWITFRLNRLGVVEALELVAVPGESWRFERLDAAGKTPP